MSISLNIRVADGGIIINRTDVDKSYRLYLLYLWTLLKQNIITAADLHVFSFGYSIRLLNENRSVKQSNTNVWALAYVFTVMRVSDVVKNRISWRAFCMCLLALSVMLVRAGSGSVIVHTWNFKIAQRKLRFALSINHTGIAVSPVSREIGSRICVLIFFIFWQITLPAIEYMVTEL